jgi:signal transduction histidine kinase
MWTLEVDMEVLTSSREARQARTEVMEQAPAQELSPAQQRWLATLGHEMRTPLNAIIGLASLMIEQRQGGQDTELVRHLGIVKCCGQHLLALGNDLLDSGRLGAGELTLDPQPLDLDDLLREVHGTLQPLATNKGLAFAAPPAANAQLLHADRRALRQIMLNLGGNAIKYTERGAIELQASADDGAVRLGVRDTGVGIAGADLQRLFRPFTQLRERADGAGLGLHLCARIARLMGAHIEVCSEPGVGSVFTLVMPRAAA